MPEIELIQPHTHAGQALAPGQRLTVSDRQAAWLQELGAAKPFAVSGAERVERPKNPRRSALQAATEPVPEPEPIPNAY